MGLDMYLFKVGKLTEKESKEIHKMKKDEVYKKYHCIDKASFDSEPAMYEDLKPYAKLITVITTFFDCEKCLKDYNIDKNKILFRSQMNDEISWHLEDKTVVTLKGEQYSQYLYDAEQEVYVFKCEEVAYWRKDYDLENFFSNTFEIENCGYYKLSNEIKQELKAYIRKHQPEDFKNNLDIKLLTSKTSNLFYHAWW